MYTNTENVCACPGALVKIISSLDEVNQENIMNLEYITGQYYESMIGYSCKRLYQEKLGAFPQF